MKQSSLYHFILWRHLRQLLLAVTSIFFLAAIFFTVSAQYRAKQHADETGRLITSYLETYFDPYIQQSHKYGQDQNIRNLFSIINHTGELSPASLQSLTEPLDLNAQTILCIDGKAIWPADSILPQDVIPKVLEKPVLIYAGSLYYVTPYYNFFQTEQLGQICYLIPFSDLINYLESFIPRDMSFCLADSVGNVFFSTGDIPSSNKTSQQVQADLFSCTVYPDLNEEMQTAGLMLLCLLLVCLLVLLFSLFSSKQVASRLSEPITALTEQLQRNQSGELNVIDAIPSHITEIDQLTQTYSTMIDRLQSLITQNQKQNLLRMEAELSLLQTQIDPHFLFNTLESISSQAILESADVTAELIQRLGTLFRYNLRAPDIVPLELELRHAADYCFLQNIQWDNQVTLDLKTESSIQTDTFQIPKLSLQPLVENCFKHAFLPGHAAGYRIAITVRQRNGWLEVCVEDNGSGIQASRIQALYQAFHQDRCSFRHFINRTNHIGLRNVNARLCIHFHIEQALWLYPVSPNGTQVVIRIPIVPTEGGPPYHVENTHRR